MHTYSCSKTRHLLLKGIFAIDKVKNKTSVENLEMLKDILNKGINQQCRPRILRLGHGGTLDSSATGVLVVGVGYGCKVLPTLLKGDKKYVVRGCLGTATDTFNETGSITKQMPFDHVTRELMESELLKFVGNIQQVPPKYSALKRGGQRLSDLVRSGCEVIVKPRPVVCHHLQCTNFSPPHFSLVVSCGGGFYVRSLVNDLGEALHTCAHVTSLRRIQQGDFCDSEALRYRDWNVERILTAIEVNSYRITNKKRQKESW